MSRVDAVMGELSARHHNRDARFLAAVRPMVERILDPALPAPARIPLMELLAETFERDAAVRRDGARAQQGVRDWFAELRRLLGLGHETEPGRDTAG